MMGLATKYGCDSFVTLISKSRGGISSVPSVGAFRLLPVFDNIRLSTTDGGLNGFESYVNSSKNFISPSLVSPTHAIMSTPLIGLNNSLLALVSRNKSSLVFKMLKMYRLDCARFSSVIGTFNLCL